MPSAEHEAPFAKQMASARPAWMCGCCSGTSRPVCAPHHAVGALSVTPVSASSGKNSGSSTPSSSSGGSSSSDLSPPVCCCGLSVLGVIRLSFLLALIMALIFSLLFFHEAKDFFLDTLTFVNELGPLRGSLVLCAANIIGALLFMPCVPFTLGAGFLYGTLIGSVIVSIASTVAAVIAFLSARYLARSWIERTCLGGRASKFRILDQAIREDGFRIVLLIRSSPLHPYGLCFPRSDHEILTDSGFMSHARIKALLTVPGGRVRVACPVMVSHAAYRLEYHSIGADALVEEVIPVAAAAAAASSSSSAAAAAAPSAGGRFLVSFRRDPLLGGRNNRLDLVVTDNHQMLVTPGSAMNLNKLKFRMMTAADVLHSNKEAVRLLCAATLGVRDPEPAQPMPFAEELELATEDQIDAFVELYGYWLGDGSIQGRAAVFCPSKAVDEPYLDALFARLPLALIPTGWGEGLDGFKKRDVRPPASGGSSAAAAASSSSSMEDVEEDGDEKDEDDDSDGAVFSDEDEPKKTGVVFAIFQPRWFAFFAQEYGHKYKNPYAFAAARDGADRRGSVVPRGRYHEEQAQRTVADLVIHRGLAAVASASSAAASSSSAAASSSSVDARTLVFPMGGQRPSDEAGEEVPAMMADLGPGTGRVGPVFLAAEVACLAQTRATAVPMGSTVLRRNAFLGIADGWWREVDAGDACRVVLNLLNPVSPVIGQDADGFKAYTFNVLEYALVLTGQTPTAASGRVIVELVPFTTPPGQCSQVGPARKAGHPQVPAPNPAYAPVWASSMAATLVSGAAVTVAFGEHVKKAWRDHAGFRAGSERVVAGTVSFIVDGAVAMRVVESPHPAFGRVDTLSRVCASLFVAKEFEAHGDVSDQAAMAIVAECDRLLRLCELQAVSVPPAAEDLKSAKWMMSWVWNRLDARRCRLLLRGLRFADGNQGAELKWRAKQTSAAQRAALQRLDEEVGFGVACSIATCSVRFRDEIVHLCLRAGFSPVFQRQYKKGDPDSWGRTHKNDLWVVVCSHENQSPYVTINSKDAKKRANEVTRIDPSEPTPVWCVSVPTEDHLIIVRRVTETDAGGVIKASRPTIVGNCNYLFGVTAVTARDYTVASFIGMLPSTILEVYLGSATKTVGAIIQGNVNNSMLSRIFFWAGLGCTVVVTVLLTVILKRKLRTEMDKYQSVATEAGDDDDDDDDFGLMAGLGRSSAVHVHHPVGARDSAIELHEPALSDALSSDTELAPPPPPKSAVAARLESPDSRRADSRKSSEANGSAGATPSSARRQHKLSASSVHSGLHAALSPALSTPVLTSASCSPLKPPPELSLYSSQHTHHSTSHLHHGHTLAAGAHSQPRMRDEEDVLEGEEGDALMGTKNV